MNAPVSIDAGALLRNRQKFLSFLKARVRSAETAEEILQDAYLKALKKSGQIRDGERVVAWFYRILRNTLYDYYRAKGAEKKAIERLAAEMPESIDGDSKLEKNLCRCMKGVIADMNPEYSDILNKAELEDKSLTELARQKGISPGNAAVKLHRARKALKKNLIQTCGSCSKHGCLDCNCKHPK